MPGLDLVGIVSRSLPSAALIGRRISAGILSEWSSQANTLGVSAQRMAEYRRSLFPSVEDRDDGVTAKVELSGTFPNMLEQGMGPGGVGTEGSYDLRTFLLRATTRNIRYGKRGMYLNVPFDRTAAFIRAVGGDAAMKAAKALSPTTSVRGPGGRDVTKWGDRMPAGMAPKLAEHHATDPLAAMVRRLGTYSQGVAQSTYRAWRTISQGGKPWIHPGIKARRLAERVQAMIPEIIRSATTPEGA